MYEYSAAVAGNARARVMVDFDDEIVKPIAALEAVAWFIGRPPERPVVAPVLGVFAPGIVRSYATDRQEGARTGQAVCPPPQPNRMKSAGRRGAIAFALCRLDAGAPQSRANRALPRHEPSLRVQPRADVHMDCRQRGSAHGVASAFCREFCQASCQASRHEPPRSSQAQFFSTQPDYRFNIPSPNVLWSHDLFRKPVSPFPDHALVSATLVLARQGGMSSH